MKYLKTLLVLTVILAVMSCRNEKDSNSTNFSNTEEEFQSNTHRNGIDNTATDDTPEEENVYGHTDYDRIRMKELYEHLDLSDDQIADYERSSREHRDTWTRTNPNKTITAQERMKLEEQSMKEFLDGNQYADYQQWVSDNPYK